MEEMQYKRINIQQQQIVMNAVKKMNTFTKEVTFKPKSNTRRLKMVSTSTG